MSKQDSNIINIIYNNKTTSIGSDNNLLNLLETWGYEISTIAVALNQTFIPRHQYIDTTLNENDCIDVVSAMQGG